MLVWATKEEYLNNWWYHQRPFKLQKMLLLWHLFDWLTPQSRNWLPSIKLCFSFVSIEMPLTKHLIACSIGLPLAGQRQNQIKLRPMPNDKCSAHWYPGGHGLFSWLPSGFTSWLKSILQIELSILFVIIEILLP